MTDEKIIKAIHDRDEKMMATVIDKYSRLLWKVASNILANISEQEIEECIADVYVDLWNNPGKFDPDKGKLSSYLSMVTRYKSIDRYRKILRENCISIESLTHEEANPEKNVLDIMIDEENKELLLKCINELSDSDKEIILRRYYHDQKPKEISVALDMPKKQIENRLYLAKQTLKQNLKENGYV